MTKRKRSYKRSVRLALGDLMFIWLGVAIFLTAILVLSLKITSFNKANRNLVRLPVPKVRQITLPGPLILANKSTSVLGFGTFDPMDIVSAVNEERSKAGSKPLRANTMLMRAAQLRADSILKNENFSHQDPYDHIELGTVLPKLGYHFIYASENIGMGGNSGRDFVNGFMHSTAHRINLLDPILTDTGVAIVDGPFDRYYVNIVVQIFTIPGGKDEYLGYGDNDRKFYETQLSAVSVQLDPTTWFFLRLGNPKRYTEHRRSLLARQKKILETVVAVMRKTEPLETNHVALIREYNKNLSSLYADPSG